MKSTFGPYTIERKVAIGGMAEIYQARNETGYPVAIKKIHPDLAKQEKFIQMFLDEVRIVTHLEHPNIVQLLDFGLIDGAYYYAMEWVEGRSLTELINEQRRLKHFMPPALAILMMMDLCDALEYAHTRKDRFGSNFGIIHRDISPPNIMISKEVVFKLTDFGIAQVKDKNVLTQPGVIRGKFSYMSPEQSKGAKLDHRSDIFSLGVVMFEALTNTSLFLKATEVKTLEAVRKADIPPISKFRSDISQNLDRCIRRILAKDVTDRFGSASEIKVELKAILRKEYSDIGREDLVNYVKSIFPEIDYGMKTMVGMSSDDYRFKGASIPNGSKKLMSRTDEKFVALFNKGLNHPNWFAAGMGAASIFVAEVLSFVIHFIRFGT